MAVTAGRAEDERLLAMLAMRRGEATTRAIGATFGISGARVAQLTDPVRAADLAESGESPHVVEAAYWPVRAKGSPDAR